YRRLSFSFNHSSTIQIYTLSLHDALPISIYGIAQDQNPFHLRIVIPDPFRSVMPVHINRTRFTEHSVFGTGAEMGVILSVIWRGDRKSTRLNSSHVAISYAVFCLKKKKNQ